MRRAVATVALWTFLIPLTAGFAAPFPAESSRSEGPRELDRIDAEARFARVVELIEDSRAVSLMGRERWAEILEAFRPGIEGAVTHPQFKTLTNRMIKATGLSHFKYYSDADWGYWHNRSYFGDDGPDKYVAHVGIFPEWIEGRWFVRGIFEGSVADGTEIRVGDEIVSVNGKPYRSVLAYEGREGKPTRIRLRRSPGQDYEVVLTPVKESLHRAIQRAMRKSIGVVEHEGLRFGYMHGWTMLGGGSEYDHLVELQDQVDGLLLDYRDGFGGTWHAAGRFILGRRTDHGTRTKPRWTKPIVILIDDGARSAKEIVVDAVQRYGVAPLVGEPTPGHVTSVGRVRRVGKNGLIMLPGQEFRLEGNPTQPDYLVPRDIRYCGGDDPQLDAAKELLSRLIDGRLEGFSAAQQQ